MSLKRTIKRLMPPAVLSGYHWLLAKLAAWKYGHPSEKLIVIGVTGTNGKSTTANLIARVLEAQGEKVGLATTINFKVAEKEWLNDTKMTMLGRDRLQALLADMVQAGCRYAVIETSSEGIKQHRHVGINYDLAVFTNLTPEHLEAHGGFENYRAAKGQLFAKLGHDPVKTIAGESVEKISLANLASEHADYYLSFAGSRKWGFLAGDASHVKSAVQLDEQVRAEAVSCTAKGCRFRVRGVDFSLNLLGWFNVENATAAVAVGLAYGIPPDESARALAQVAVIPGRLEPVDVGQEFGVLIDYAPEPESVRKLYEAVALLERPAGSRIIHLLGSCGGGRDRDRRPVLGRLAAENADIVIVTDEDPYDDDPQEIIDEVAAGAREAGQTDGENLFRILNRYQAIQKAVSLARPGDLIVATGKGAEQAICRADGRKDPWDERERFKTAIMAWQEEGRRACNNTNLPDGGEPIGG